MRKTGAIATFENRSRTKWKSKSTMNKKSRSMNANVACRGEMGSEYVSLEDLAPLAMDKIEASSIEGLRILLGMSDEESPSNICPQSFGDMSALEGKGTINSSSLGLEGTGGLQLLDVKDSGYVVDGLMCLSISLDEWMKLDSGVVDDEDVLSDQTSKILSAHHACSLRWLTEGVKEREEGEVFLVIPSQLLQWCSFGTPCGTMNQLELQCFI